MRISVVIPLYNKRDFVMRTLRSVLAQTLPALEILVVDDGSTDGGAEMIEAANLPRVRVIRQANAGVSAARNRGAGEAVGEYVALLDADDWWEPEFLKKIAENIEKFPGCGIYCSGFCIHRPGRVYENEHVIRQAGIVENYFRTAFRATICWTSAAVLDRGKWLDAGGFPVGMRRGQDLWMWTKMALRYPVCYTPERLSNYNLLTAAANSKGRYRIEERPFNFMDFYAPGDTDLNEYLARIQIGIAILQSVSGYTARARKTERQTSFTRRYRLGWWKLRILNRLPVPLRRPLLDLYIRLSLLVSPKSAME